MIRRCSLQWRKGRTSGHDSVPSWSSWTPSWTRFVRGNARNVRIRTWHHWSQRETKFVNIGWHTGHTERGAASASEDEEKMQGTRERTDLKTRIQRMTWAIALWNNMDTIWMFRWVTSACLEAHWKWSDCMHRGTRQRHSRFYWSVRSSQSWNAGYHRVVLQTDWDPAIDAMAEAIRAERALHIPETVQRMVPDTATPRWELCREPIKMSSGRSKSWSTLEQEQCVVAVGWKPCRQDLRAMCSPRTWSETRKNVVWLRVWWHSGGIWRDCSSQGSQETSKVGTQVDPRHVAWEVGKSE